MNLIERIDFSPYIFLLEKESTFSGQIHVSQIDMCLKEDTLVNKKQENP